MEIVYDLEDIGNAANEFLEYCNGYRVFAFTGELGAGKTTFISSICAQLGVKEIVTSPTYALIQEYHFAKDDSILHIDLYRLKNIEEAIEAGVEDCLFSDKMCMVEWPERAMLLFPPETVYANLHLLSANMRKMIVQLPQ
ncbi:MAG: tRNA (adenosine(37)-N6)-threonylcarbamoyltransferase complex ATPase subunit type 1 TsaE [Ginsengibacter sp.]